MSRRTLRTKALTGVVALAVVGIGQLLTSHLPDELTELRPFEAAGHIDESVDVRTGSVRVQTVNGGTSLRSPIAAMRTSNLWVVIAYTFTPSRSTTGLFSIEMVAANGMRWSGTASRNQNLCTTSVPGLPIQCQAAIEVPADYIIGAHLELAPTADLTQYDAVAVIDLEITPDVVADWKANPEVTLQGSTLGAS